LPTPCPATRNLSFWRCSPAPSPCCFNSLFHWDWYGLVRKFHKMEIAQTCTGTWRWCVSMFGARFAVFVRRARVLPSPCLQLFVLEVSLSCFFEISTKPGTVDDGNRTDGIPVKNLSHTCTQDTKYDSTTAQHYGYTRVLPVYVYYYFFIFFVFYTCN
jgi:hypothetical protein